MNHFKLLLLVLAVFSLLFTEGCRDKDEPVKADFAASSANIDPGETVTFTDNSTGGPTTWQWSFPGGTPDFSAEKNPSVQYLISGTYSVSLTVSRGGSSDTKTATNLISVSTVKADFEADTTQLDPGGTVAFTDKSSGGVAQWEWSFPGGTPDHSTDENPAVQYLISGTYAVTLTATNGENHDTKTTEDYITVNDVVADFSASVNEVDPGGTVQFTDESTGGATQWNWSFPGGTPDNSTEQNPLIEYLVGGAHDVTLTAMNGDNSNTVKKEDYIVVSMTADFAVNRTTVYARHSVQFSDESQGSPASWDWSFDGGSPVESNKMNPIIFYPTPGTYGVSEVIATGDVSDSEAKDNLIEVLDNPVPTDGLVLEYTMEDGARDTGPLGLDGEVDGALSTNDRYDSTYSAYSFSSPSEVLFPHHNDFNSLPLTISFWVKFDGLSANILGTDIGDGNTLQGIYFTLGKSVDNLNHLAIAIGNGGAIGVSSRRTFVSDFAVESGTWYHIVGIVEESLTMHIFVDDVEQTGSYSGTAVTYFQSSHDGVLGTTCNPSDYFSGVLDQFRIYNRILSAEEIEELYEEK